MFVRDYVWFDNEIIINTIILVECQFESISIDRCQFKGGLEISDSNFNDTFSIDNTHVDNHFIIEGVTVKNDIFLTNLSISGLSLKIIDTESKNMLFTSCDIKSSEMWLDNNMARIDISSSTINSLSIWDIPEKRTLSIIETKVPTMVLDGLINLGYMQWSRLTIAEIQLEDSIMGKWDIVNCDFSKTKFALYSSKITDAFYTNTVFPVQLYLPENESYKENRDDIFRDGYNQLKTLAQKQNDRKLFLHYQAAELRSFKSTLKLWKDWKTIFQLFAMKISNDYGTDWVQGVKFVLICNLVFVIACFALRPFQFDCIGIGNFIGLFLSSLSSLIALPKLISTTSNWEMNWFYLSRIPLAFGIYQTIAAFRKFGKSE